MKNKENSKILQQDKIYVKVAQNGHTQIIKSKNIEPGARYRRVHYTQYQLKKSKYHRSHFVDSLFAIEDDDFDDFDHNGRKIVVKRLTDLLRICPPSFKPYFFPPKDYSPLRKQGIDPSLPSCIQQFGLYPVQHWRSFFLTQDFAQSGLYQMVYNKQGRFQNDIVDDLVPVYEDTYEPIWGLELDQAWKIIIVKIWAKISGGYDKVQKSAPFNFVQAFTNSNWKYYNLKYEADTFLSFYKNKTKQGKIILKTKNSNVVMQMGLNPFSCGYELVNLVQTTPAPLIKDQKIQGQNRKYLATIRSTVINKWTGSLSVVDANTTSIYKPQQYCMAMDRDLLMDQTNFKNLFSTAYISSNRQQTSKNYCSDYLIMQLPPDNQSSIYLKFILDNDGWFDFGIKQFDHNRILPSSRSMIRIQQSNQADGVDGNLRFLKCRYLLAKYHQKDDWKEEQPNQEYIPLGYQCIDIEYFKGYSRGDARFLQLEKGTYVLKIKPQRASVQSTFVFNYACEQKLKLKQIFPSKKQTSQILRQSMASMIGLITHYSLDQDKNMQQIAFANLFQEIGHGFVGVRVKKQCKYRVLIQVDPQLVKQSGYKFKNQFKNIQEPFSIVVSPGESTSIVMKKLTGKQYIWPPKGIQIFKQI